MPTPTRDSRMLDHDLERQRSSAAAWLFLTALPWLRALDTDAHPPPRGHDGDPHEHLIFVGHRARAQVRAEARVLHELAHRVVAGEALRSPRLPSIVAAAADSAAIDVPSCVNSTLFAFSRGILARSDVRDALTLLTTATLHATATATAAALAVDGTRGTSRADPPIDSLDAGDRAMEIAIDVIMVLGSAIAIALRAPLADVALAALSGDLRRRTLDDRVRDVIDHAFDHPTSALFGRLAEFERSSAPAARP